MTIDWAVIDTTPPMNTKKELEDLVRKTAVYLRK